MTTVLVKKYNPLEMSKDDVLALATGREKLLDIMLTEMKVCLKKGSNQHFVLHGPRGIGKSFFTRLLKIHHDQSDDFENSLFLQLPEEQENINFASDLLDVVSTFLEGGKFIDTAPKWSITDGQWQKSKQRLRDALGENERKGTQHVFVTQENLQSFIPKLDKIESSRLREFLSDFDEVTIIGSSLRPDLDNDYSKRLFQVFKKLDIEPWTAEDFLTYYDKLAQYSNNDKDQIENLKRSKNKIKAISQFTGGSPRLAVILSKLILEKNILDTAQLLDGIIDELTTYYQDITNDIPAKSKILFDMLIRKGENMTQSTLAASFEPPLEQKDIARSFAWLTDNYYVINTKQNKGNTKYFFVRDRLYVLYYQKRQVYADVPFSFVGVFVDFLNAFYSKKEKIKELKNLDLNHSYALPVLSFLAKKEGIFEESIQNSELIRDSLIRKYTEDTTNKVESFVFNDGDYIERDFEKVITKYKNEIIENPNNYMAYIYLGYEYQRNGDFEKGIAAIEKAISIDPEYSVGYVYLGHGYQENGEFEKATTAFEKAISIDPKNSTAYVYLGYGYQEKGDFEKAISEYEKALNLNPKDDIAYFNLGIIYAEKVDFERAISCFEQALNLHPEFAFAHHNLGVVYGKMGNFKKAISCFEKSLILDPNNAKTYDNLGSTYSNQGLYEKAIISFDKALKLDPGYSISYIHLGLVYNIQGDYEKALAILFRGLKIKSLELNIINKSLSIIINQQQWQYLNQFSDHWKGNKPFSSIIGESLYKVLKENQNNKFFYFKNTFDSIRNFPFVNFNEAINGLCLGIYKDGDMDFLRQIVDELSHDFADEAFVMINLEVYKYLLNPEGIDINQLHPDVRTVVQSILQDK
ncbi:MAG: tetratricopeptide repeat protein [Saprospiraceae bacterium]